MICNNVPNAAPDSLGQLRLIFRIFRVSDTEISSRICQWSSEELSLLPPSSLPTKLFAVVLISFEAHAITPFCIQKMSSLLILAITCYKLQPNEMAKHLVARSQSKA